MKTATKRPGRLVGAKAVLNYLRQAHQWRMSRTTLNVYSRRRGNKRFPLESGIVGRRQWVTASAPAIDRWVRENRTDPPGDQVRTLTTPAPVLPPT